MKEIEIYRVVTQSNRQLVSATANSCRTRYRVNKWTKPRQGNGPLTAFRSLADALEFRAIIRGDTEIWGGVPDNEQLPHVIYRAIAIRSRKRCVWTGTSKKDPVHERFPGTVYCDKIKLLGRVV